MAEVNTSITTIFPNSRFTYDAGEGNGDMRYSVICGNAASGDHLIVECEPERDQTKITFTGSGQPVKAQPLTPEIFLVPSQQCVLGSTRGNSRFGRFVLSARLFVISQHGFAGVDIVSLSLNDTKLLSAPSPVSLEADARGSAIAESSCAQDVWLSGQIYSLRAGRQEISIEPFQIEKRWIEELQNKNGDA